MKTDFLIIGAGISGAAAAYELAPFGRVMLVEAEPRLGVHSTGRSAAMYTPNYGSQLVCTINALSYDFLQTPPVGFSESPLLLSPRGMMTVALVGQEAEFAALVAECGPGFDVLTAEQTLERSPILRAETVLGGVFEAGVSDMDVDALHQGFLRGLRQQGGELLLDHAVTALSKTATGWQARVGEHQVLARVVINAAGAWADHVATLAGLTPVGLVPKRRTAILLDPPKGVNVSGMPLMDFIGVDNYIKPETAQLMVSPGDATAVAPQDIQPDDMDVAVLVDWLESVTTMDVRRLNHQWAGLRNFVPDGSPVVGLDPDADGFFWLAGQGGYGMMMSSALARATASLLTSNSLPQDFVDAGVRESDLSAGRFR